MNQGRNCDAVMDSHFREGADADQRRLEADQERLEKAVALAEQALIEFEIAVEAFRVEVDNFARLHHQRLGPMYARLDELDALIAEAVAARTGDPDDIRRAHDARSVVQPMPDVDELFGRPSPHPDPDRDGAGGPDQSWTEQPRSEPEPPRRVRPGKEAQRLYRELARQAHPDLAQDPQEQELRSAFLARANEAYSRGDEEALRELAEEWAARTESYEGQPHQDDPEQPAHISRIEVLYARLNWLAARQEAMSALRAELEEGAVGAMLRMAPDDPDVLLNEIADQLLAQVAEREAKLAELT